MPFRPIPRKAQEGKNTVEAALHGNAEASEKADIDPAKSNKDTAAPGDGSTEVHDGLIEVASAEATAALQATALRKTTQGTVVIDKKKDDNLAGEKQAASQKSSEKVKKQDKEEEVLKMNAEGETSEKETKPEGGEVDEVP